MVVMTRSWTVAWASSVMSDVSGAHRETKNLDILLFEDHPRLRPKLTGQAGFGAAEPPREAMSLPGCIPQGGRLGYSCFSPFHHYESAAEVGRRDDVPAPLNFKTTHVLPNDTRYVGG